MCIDTYSMTSDLGFGDLVTFLSLLPLPHRQDVLVGLVHRTQILTAVLQCPVQLPNQTKSTLIVTIKNG